MWASHSSAAFSHGDVTMWHWFYGGLD